MTNPPPTVSAATPEVTSTPDGGRAANSADTAASRDDLACPSVSDKGDPCRKQMFRTGSGEVIDHAGGHSYMSDEVYYRMSLHYDASLALAGLPFTTHEPSECPGPPECYVDLLR